MEKLTITVQEAHEASGIDKQKLLRMCRAGDIPARKVGKRWFIPARAFGEWLLGDYEKTEAEN